MSYTCDTHFFLVKFHRYWFSCIVKIIFTCIILVWIPCRPYGLYSHQILSVDVYGDRHINLYSVYMFSILPCVDFGNDLYQKVL